MVNYTIRERLGVKGLTVKTLFKMHNSELCVIQGEALSNQLPRHSK